MLLKETYHPIRQKKKLLEYVFETQKIHIFWGLDETKTPH